MPPDSCAQAPETAEMSLAAWALFFCVICPNAILTPPRQVCSVSMPTPCTEACALVLDNEPFVVASALMVEAIDACRASRFEAVTALATSVTATL